ncbi:hypothetical protein [Deinococcus hopiensis]|uniref:hypothetical protein n=1 Tax=Deinococcus hopiensis TaxID=309885 RepID=UPI00111C89C7|nr:hypothetical protein [Deinococcus hopiensis]
MQRKDAGRHSVEGAGLHRKGQGLQRLSRFVTVRLHRNDHLVLRGKVGAPRLMEKIGGGYLGQRVQLKSQQPHAGQLVTVAELPPDFFR